MRYSTDDRLLIKDVKCRNFDTCQRFTTKSYANDFGGNCPECAIKSRTSPYTLDQLDELKSKRKSHNALY